MTYRTLNPATEEIIRSYPLLLWEETERRAEKCREAFLVWREFPVEKRAELVLSLAAELLERKKEFAALMTTEMGKPAVQAATEIEKCALGCEFYAENAARFLRPEPIATDASKSYIRFDPLGSILGIMPWNFPFWQVFRFSIPALMAGNAILLKHAPNVPGCAIEIEELFRETGFPENLFQSLFLDNESVERLIASPFVQGVSLTGSDRAGSEVAATAGRALKKTVLELGGSDPFIVFGDADLEKAVAVAVRSRMLNTGQSCIAAKRLIVSKEIYRPFEKALVAAVKRLKVGDPKDPSTQIGPMARRDLLQNLDRQVKKLVTKGAKVLTGGRRMPRKGFFYQPTVLKVEEPVMALWSEEIFGPVAVLTSIGSNEEAVSLANRTAYGLGASLWTRDLERAERLAGRIEAGSVFINGMVKSDARLPFGGIKRSGYGRELSAIGLREFTNVKTVWIG